MTTPVLADVEAMVTNFLRNTSEVTTVCGDRIYTDMPHKRTFPLVLVTRIGGNFVINTPLWLDQSTIQLDVFGGTHKQAWTLTALCLSTMAAGLVGAHPEGCCTGIVSGQILYNPEIDWLDEQGHARPR